MIKKNKIKLHSASSLQELLQEVSNMVYMQLNEIQECINTLQNSTKLSEEAIEGKAKYAKALHDFMTDKDKAQKMLLDVGKLMNDVLKTGSEVDTLNKVNTKDGVQLDSSSGFDVSVLRGMVDSKIQEEEEVKTYKLTKN